MSLLEFRLTAVSNEHKKSVPTHWLGMQDSKKIKSAEPYFELLTTELCATEDRVFNVSRFLPSIRFV